MDPTVVDGSALEGGGQILRNAAALAAILGRPVRVDNIRAGRSQPGLRPQHLTGLRLVRDICAGELLGGAVNAASITLIPAALQPPSGVSLVADTGTAGSCTLLLQSALPCALFARPRGTPPRGAGAAGDAGEGGSSAGELPPPGGPAALSFTLRGGTDAGMAPPVGYLQHVLAPTLRRAFGVTLRVDVARRGFYPKGGGEVLASVHCLQAESALPCVSLVDRGALQRVTIHAFAAGRLRDGFEAQLAAAAAALLRRRLESDIALHEQVTRETAASAVGTGGGLLLVAESSTGCLFGASCVADKGISVGDMAEQAVQELCECLSTDACVDQWMQDQLIILAALASGTSFIRCGEPTLHTRTAMCVCEQLLPGCKFLLHRPGSSASGSQSAWLLECQGVGRTA